MKKFLLLTLLLCLSSCISPPPQEVKLINSPYTPYYEVRGMIAVGEIMKISEEWQLVTEIDKNLPNQHRNYVFVSIRYPIKQGRFITASDDKAQDLPLTRVHKSPLRCRGCDIKEDLAIDIDENYLAAHFNTGIKIRMVSDQGYQHFITITPKMVQSQIVFVQSATQELLQHPPKPILSSPPAHSS